MDQPGVPQGFPKALEFPGRQKSLQAKTAAARSACPCELDSRDSHGANHLNKYKYMNSTLELNPLNPAAAAQEVGSPARGTSDLSMPRAPGQVTGGDHSIPLFNRPRVACARRHCAPLQVSPNIAVPGDGPERFEQTGQVQSVNIEGCQYAWKSPTISVREIRRMANLPADQAVVCEDDEGHERTLAEDEVVTLKPGLRHGRAPKYKRG